MIRAYTDGSATKATINAGYGACTTTLMVVLPQQRLFLVPVDRVVPIMMLRCKLSEKTLATVLNQFEDGTVDPTDIAVFSDSQSALEALLNRSVALTTGGIDAILTLAGRLQETYGIEIHLQWIPGHIGLQGNERADTLAKFGATRQQTDIPTSYAAARTAIAEIGRKRWLRRWVAS